MSDNKKEIFDYLRNFQKAAEIEAKINGVNIWALLGAAALVTWQLLGSAILWDARSGQLILRTIVGAQMVYLLKAFLNPPGRRKDDVRFFSYGSGDPYMWILGGIGSGVPLVLFTIYVERNPFLLIPFILSVASIILGVIVILKSVSDEKEGVGKLPKPTFTFTTGFERLLALLAVGSFTWVFISQLSSIFREVVSPEVAKSLVLVAVLYLLVLTIFDRKSRNHTIAWTYELETDLLLEVITPAAALRRIEYQRLGPRLRDVVDAFCADFESRFDFFDETLRGSREKIASVNEIPGDYQLERKGRVEEALAVPRATLTQLIKDSEKFYKYITEIEKRHTVLRKSALQVILKSLFERQKGYENRIRDAKAELDAVAGSAPLK